MEPSADPPARTVVLRALTPEDAAAYRPLRLEALQDAPSAFASSFEEETGRDLDAIRARLQAGPEGATFGAFLDGHLVGTCSVFRMPRLKERRGARALRGVRLRGVRVRARRADRRRRRLRRGPHGALPRPGGRG